MITSAMTKETARKRRVLALGLLRLTARERVIVRGMEGVVAAARASFPDASIEIVTIRSLKDFEEDFGSLSNELSESYAAGKFRRIASAYFLQEALEGRQGITDIHYDLSGMDSIIAKTQAGSELRSLVAHILAFHPRKMNIHFRCTDGLASHGKTAMAFEGAPLPCWLSGRFADLRRGDNGSG